MTKLLSIASLAAWEASFEADPATGLLYKKTSKGLVITGYVPKDGRPIVNCFNGSVCRVHRVNWLLWTGEEPNLLDHINGDKLDNRLSNLRVASTNQNCFNTILRKDNTTGYKGVFEVWNLYSKAPKYGARVTAYGKNYNLGCFNTAEEANEACKTKRRELHTNFYNDGRKD